MEEGVAYALWWLPTVLASVPVQSSGEVAEDGHADDGQRDLSLTAASPSLSPPSPPPPPPTPVLLASQSPPPPPPTPLPTPPSALTSPPSDVAPL
eukprot:scaffold1708_cov51-Phaeocystis_antarctica.AAC.5